jgi:hypothetical protein
MKTCAFSIIAFIVIIFIPSCSKELSAENQLQSEKLKVFVQGKKFQIAEYYSDRPIDYDESDSVVKQETDLWQYVSSWLKDDLNSFDFNSNTVSIEQVVRKIPNNNAAVIVQTISVGEDKEGAYFTFLDYRYQPFTYRLVEINADYFIVYANWHSGAKVYTKFRVVSQ